jgi:hypothetical protein
MWSMLALTERWSISSSQVGVQADLIREGVRAVVAAEQEGIGAP